MNLCYALTLTLLFTNLAVAESPAESESVSANTQVVAEINSQKILKVELEEELRRNLKGKLALFNEEEQHRLRKRMLDMMITRRMLMASAERSKVAPSKEEVDRFFTDLKNSFPSPEAFTEHLAKNGLNEKDFRIGLGEDLAIQYYLEKLVLKDVTVTDAALEAEYKKNANEYRTPEEIKARHILIRVPEGAKEEEVEAARRRAEEILKKVRTKGTDFAAVARSVSEASNKGKGGELDFFTREQMDAEFSDAAFALKVGEISTLVKTKFGYHIIMVEEKRGGEIPSFESVKEKIRAQLYKAAQERTLAEHIDALKKENKVIIYFQ